MELKKTRFPDSNTKREPCRPALLDIGESLSAYLQADFNIIPYSSDVNTFCENFTKFFVNRHRKRGFTWLKKMVQFPTNAATADTPSQDGLAAVLNAVNGILLKKL